MNTYQATFIRRCPKGESEYIVYELTIESIRMILVEQINAAIATLPDPIFHEDASRLLADSLNIYGDQLSLVATHQGVKITSCIK